MGGVEGQRDEAKSLHSFVKSHDASIDGHVTTAIETALQKINAMPAPFVLHYSEAANGAAVEACSELSDALGEINNLLRELN